MNPIRLSKKEVLGDHCKFCGRKDVRLIVHHKNGDVADNDSRNLILLCDSCHRRTHKLEPTVEMWDSRRFLDPWGSDPDYLKEETEVDW